ncbi:MAG: SLC13 family permease [Bryobacterales bacterium]|nr:SLC13 family permease [Bryobacterales bacterium]
MAIAIVLLLTVACIYVLATEKLAVDLTAIFVAMVLIATHVLTPEQGLSGFGNPATVTVAAMFVLSAGLAKTGALNGMTGLLTRIGKRFPWVAILLTMLVAGAASAFVNNTAVVAILMPVTLEVGRLAKISPSRLLMPLSFASMFGGVCTIIGTSTNILVSSIAERHGIHPFSMFELSEMGLVLAGAGIAYMFLIGIRLIPERRGDEGLTDVFGTGDYLTDVVLLPEAKSIGSVAAASSLVKDLDVQILAVFREGQRLAAPPDQVILRAGDVIRVLCNTAQIGKLRDRLGASLISHLGWHEQDPGGDQLELVEAVVSPISPIRGRTLKSLHFSETFGAKVLAIRHHGQIAQDKLDSQPLNAGDALLISVRRDQLEALARDPAFVLVTKKVLPRFRFRKTLTAAGILASVVAAAALGVMPIVVAALAGSAAMVMTGCLKADEVYPAVDWKVVMMLGGLLPLGVAIETTGLAAILSRFIVDVFGSLGPWVLLSALYLCTSLLTEIMSNAATAVLLTPIAITAAAAMGVDARPFLVTVMFAASSSFMTPVGYQTNTLIYGPGAYRFADFLRVGTLLNVLFWILATALIPRFWPFHP